MKLKIVVGVAITLITLASSLSSASALIESTKETGESEATSESFPFHFTFEGGGATVTCKGPSSTKEGELAKWKIVIRKIFAEQERIRLGHPTWFVPDWGICHLKSSSLKEVTPKITGCELEIDPRSEKEPSSGKGLGNVLSECNIEASSSCSIQVPAGKREGKIGNWNLPEASYVNSGANLAVKAAFSGLKDTVSSGCGSVGIRALECALLEEELTFPEDKTV